LPQTNQVYNSNKTKTMKNLITNKLLLSIVIVVFAIACQKNETSPDYSNLVVADIKPEQLNQARYIGFVDALFDLQSDGELTESEIKSVGNPIQDLDMAAALINAKAFEPQRTNTANARVSATNGTVLYKWTGKRDKKYWFCLCTNCYVYEAKVGNTFGYGCSTIDITNKGTAWVNRSQLNCSKVPAAQKGDCN
jgi:hypothetical protein